MAIKKTAIFLLSFLISISCFSREVATAQQEEKQVASQEKSATTLMNSSESLAPTDLSKPILVKSSAPVFKVVLAANGTTGYQWYLVDYNPRFVKLLEQKYVAPNNTQLVGAPGVSIWEFQLQQISFNAPQIIRIKFEYRRPWESRSVKKESITVVSEAR